jgi:hypothetical protein
MIGPAASLAGVFTFGKLEYSVSRRNGRKARGVMSSVITAPAEAGPSLLLYIPVMPDYLGQRAISSRVLVNGNEVSPQVFVPKDSAQKFFALKLDSNDFDFSRGIKVEAIYDAELFDTILERTTSSRNQSKEDHSKYVLPTEHLDFNASSFRAFLDKNGLRKEPTQSALEFVFNCQLTLQRIFRGADANIPDERHASKVCSWPKLECNTSSTLMTAVCRANGVPARLLNGRNTRSDPHPLGTSHFRFEFWEPTIGWVPVEASGAWDIGESSLRRTFATIEKNLMVLAIDSDFSLLLGKQSQVHQTANSMRFMWTFNSGGKPIDWTRVKSRDHWQFDWL